MSKRYLPIILGICTTLGFAPFHLTFLLIFTLSIIYREIKTSSIKEVFLFSILFGGTFFFTSLYWIAFSLATDIKNLWWLIVPTPIVLALFLSLYFSFAFLLFKAIALQNPFTFTIFLTLAEYLREVCFTGFPWNQIGYSWNSLEILQLASIFGIFGVTAFTCFIAASLGELLFNNSITSRRYFFFSILLFVATFSFGTIRLKSNPTQNSSKTVRIVQANISHQQIWNTAFQKRVLEEYLKLSISKDFTKVDYFIWPESSLPFLFSNPENHITQHISKILRKPLIAAGTRKENNSFFNSIFIVRDGKIIEYYDKVKLIPLGEYAPLEKVVPIKKIVNGISSFTPGKEGGKILKSIKALPLLCYESIFSTFVTNKEASEWIVNLTNDSWFGNTTARYQHLQMARIRAIENGLPMIRSTTTGISAVIDPYGRILKTIDYSSRGILDIQIPTKHPRKTLYSLLLQNLTP